MENIFTENAPPPGGHYSQAVKHNGFVYISGQLPIKAKTGEKVTGAIEEQITVVLENLEAILKASGSSKSQVLKVNVYLGDIEHWGTFNDIYTEFFGEHKPARAVVPTKSLHYGFLVEVDAVAAC